MLYKKVIGAMFLATCLFVPAVSRIPVDAKGQAEIKQILGDTESYDETETESTDTETADTDTVTETAPLYTIGEVEFETYRKTYKASGKIYKRVSYQYPIIKGDNEAAVKFNEFYSKQLAKWKKNSKKNLDEEKKTVLENFKDSDICFGDQVTCEVTNQDGQYLSIMQSGYEYTLGAHGMPYRDTYTFDESTGEKVTATQILGLTKKKVNQKARKLFVKKYKKNSEYFFANNVIDLKEQLNNLDFVKLGNYYIKNGKLIFYVYPYDLGPYAAGFIEASMKL